MLCCVLTGVVPSVWHELCSWSLGKPHILSFDFRLQDSRYSVSPSDKTRSQTGKGKQACELQGTGSGVASGVTWSILTWNPLFLSWAIVTQRLEATPEPGRTLCKDLVQWQCHLSREVGTLGCPRSPLPRPLPCLPKWSPETHFVTLPESVIRMCHLCPQLQDSKGHSEGPALMLVLVISVLLPS